MVLFFFLCFYLFLLFFFFFFRALVCKPRASCLYSVLFCRGYRSTSKGMKGDWNVLGGGGIARCMSTHASLMIRSLVFPSTVPYVIVVVDVPRPPPPPNACLVVEIPTCSAPALEGWEGLYGHTTTAMHEIEYPTPPHPPLAATDKGRIVL